MNRRNVLAMGGAGALTFALSQPTHARTGISLIKMVFVGNSSVGKSSMLVSFTTNQFPVGGVTAGFDTLSANIMHDGHPTQLELTDTPGAEDYDRIRPLSYPGTAVVGIGFSVVSRSSFEGVTEKWLPEIRQHLGQTPIILIGMKADLRDDVTGPYSDPISREECEALADQIGAAAYHENSALTQVGLAQTFHTMISAARGELDDAPGSPIRRQRRPGQGSLTPTRRPRPRRGGN
jgi:small GTP-binding protein